MLSIEKGREFVTQILERGRIIEPSDEVWGVVVASMQFRYELCEERSTITPFRNEIATCKGRPL